jgi:type III pantothenate kinase
LVEKERGYSAINGMLFCLDIGNTVITLGLFDDDKLAHHWRITTEARRSADEYATLIVSLLQLKSQTVNDVHDACLVSVVPQLTSTMIEMCQHYMHLEPLVVDAGVRTGVRIRTENPREVGADRIVNTVAAFRLYGGPACVVDFSTATSFDAVSREGDYLGGAIAPGLGVALDALTERTAKLPKVEILRPPKAIGRNTIQSMQSGFLFGIVGLVEGMVKRFRRELGDDMLVIATGNLADTVARETDMIQVLAPWLALDGLRFVHALNRS